jgi:Uma2 family endonuclease
MRIQVVTGEGRPVTEPFLIRLGGWTEERYFAEAPEDRLWEFEDGEAIVHSPATPGHQRVVGFLTFLLKGYVEERDLGEVLNGPAVLRLRPGADKEPDLFFLHRDRRGSVGPTRVDGPADLVVEVTSPGTRSYDLEEKARVYREGGVAEYWVVDPERQEVVVHRAAHPQYRVMVVQSGRLESTAVAGFWIEVAWLWQDPLPSAPACLRQVLSRGG